ncbi:hypothetical protein [Paenibacillus eucommiae]|uniref:DUF3168 domain-containing protein n=1 Tax=Paenibacillus eucommiae TaxID=1355755 RepID=A0ABS4IY83_9BACL|nr:hypothetical protein [Paenibacillus eucommiae]MBP1992547.1 hypothetical protein [Paenibacillus eucommiae]
MSKVVEMRKALQSIIKAKHSRVYYEMAPDDVQFPYVTYELPNSYDDGTMENFVLHVDGWDAPAKGDTMPLEMIMEEIDSVLQRQVIRTNGMAFVIYRDNRLSIPDDDKRIRRRKIVYQVRTFGGN